MIYEIIYNEMKKKIKQYEKKIKKLCFLQLL